LSEEDVSAGSSLAGLPGDRGARATDPGGTASHPARMRHLDPSRPGYRTRPSGRFGRPWVTRSGSVSATGLALETVALGRVVRRTISAPGYPESPNRVQGC